MSTPVEWAPKPGRDDDSMWSRSLRINRRLPAQRRAEAEAASPYSMNVEKTAERISVADTDLDFIETYEAMKQEGEGFTGQFSEKMSADIPVELLREMNEHGMPIYSGTTPPVIEGVYDFSPQVMVWASDDCYKPGDTFASSLYEFSNQNNSQGLVDYRSKVYSARYSAAISEEEGKASKIEGSGSHFTAWYIETGHTYYIKTKKATIISGTVTDEGIKDMYFTFTMLEKGNDEFHRVVDPGTIRTFKDMDGSEWYAEAVYALAGFDIIRGYSDGSFHANESISRAAFTAIAIRLAKETVPDNAERFSDVPSGHWARGTIARASDYGWIGGYEDGTFHPSAPITRAAVTAIINRMLNRNADEEYVAEHYAELNHFSDVTDSNAWYFHNVMEAANAHDFNASEGKERWTR